MALIKSAMGGTVGSEANKILDQVWLRKTSNFSIRPTLSLFAIVSFPFPVFHTSRKKEKEGERMELAEVCRAKSCAP